MQRDHMRLIIRGGKLDLGPIISMGKIGLSQYGTAENGLGAPSSLLGATAIPVAAVQRIRYN